MDRLDAPLCMRLGCKHSAEMAAKDKRIAELEALLSRMCDAYECICGDTNMRYDLSPKSVYAAARKALTP